MRTFESADGIRWAVRVQSPGASNAMVVYRHPDGNTTRHDRYAWVNINRPEARDVTARLDPRAVLDGLTDADLARLFRRSMLVSAADNPLGIPITHSA